MPDARWLTMRRTSSLLLLLCILAGFAARGGCTGLSVPDRGADPGAWPDGDGATDEGCCASGTWAISRGSASTRKPVKPWFKFEG